MKVLLNRTKLADLLGVSRRTIYNMVASGELPECDYKITHRGINLWYQHNIIKALEHNKNKTKQDFKQKPAKQ